MLIAVEYPVELSDIVVVGWLGGRSRSLTIRPKHAGDYTLLVAPRYFPDSRWIVRHDLSFRSSGGPPVRLVFDLDRHRLRSWREWEWCLVRRSAIGKWVSAADALFSATAVARGRFEFEDVLGSPEVRTLVWSCHQPFETHQGRARTHGELDAILPWYQRELDSFAPHVVWGLGDTGYSDGTAATNFADQAYATAGWHLSPASRETLRALYRSMYRHHWSFQELQHAMRTYPHVFMWDDHEIRDGWGSEEKDLDDSSQTMFRIARDVAEEYLFNVGPRWRPDGDAHSAYLHGAQANFVFDTRSSRNYADPGGRIISDQQLADFLRFVEQVIQRPQIRFCFLGTTVPFVYLKEWVEGLLSRAPKVLTDLIAGVRDDIRDSWRSPGNREAFRQVLTGMRRMAVRRPDLRIVNISGDIHVANAFEIWPPGFPRPFYQVTTSAITNRQHLSSLASELLVVPEVNMLPDLGLVRRIWTEVTDPNFLRIATTQDRAHLVLSVLPGTEGTPRDRELMIR
jgi:hypothetical protein